MINNTTQAGIHFSAESKISAAFTKHERNIVRYWAREWFITFADKIDDGTSSYKYIIVKPTEHIEEALGISREVVVIFSDYDSYEPRTIEAFDIILRHVRDARIEKLCLVIISRAQNLFDALKEYSTNNENQIIVPFTYASFEEHRSDDHFIRNTFRQYFFSRDLFDISEPLRKETFFFGRTDIVTQIIAKHRSGYNFGVFGLRKTGKTSIIFDVIRKSTAQGFLAVFIDCQDTNFTMRRWNKALYCVAKEIENTSGIASIATEDDYTEENASKCLAELLKRVKTETGKTLLLLFDEIENITFEKSSVEHWCTGLDFIYFWQSIRSCYHQLSDTFTFCIFGTNAKCVEEPVFRGKDNPIYNMIQPTYIPGFDVQQTRDMVRKLGRIMGITFDEVIYAKLVEDYGGHPFLMRRLCSKIAQTFKTRPVTIDRNKYAQVKKIFNLEDQYFEMILGVLQQFYIDEFEMLQYLAKEDYETFNFFATQDYSYVRHLIGYGLICQTDDSYDFKIDAIKDYLLRKSGHKLLKSDKEKWTHLCAERNEIEKDLRDIVRRTVRVIYKNESAAKEYIIKKLLKGANKFYSYPYNDLFDSKKSEIYLNGLRVVIMENWDYFSDCFGKQDVFSVNMQVLNNEGRFDAHASSPDDSEIDAVDHAVSYFVKCIEKYKKEIN